MGTTTHHHMPGLEGDRVLLRDHLRRYHVRRIEGPTSYPLQVLQDVHEVCHAQFLIRCLSCSAIGTERKFQSADPDRGFVCPCGSDESALQVAEIRP